MFTVYLRRELRRRRWQAIVISAGLALGIGLVITVTAASAGVRNAQASVLQNLYGAGTSATVTEPPAAGSFAPPGFHRFAVKPGQTVRIDQLTATPSLGSLRDSDVAAIARLRDVAAASGSVTAVSTNVTFKIPHFNQGGFGPSAGGSGRPTRVFGGPGGLGRTPPVTVDGVDLNRSSQPLGPLSNGTLAAGRTFTSADANAAVAVVDSTYATSDRLRVGSVVPIAGTTFTVVGIVTVPASDAGADVYIPLQRAQALASPSMAGKVNTIYVAADSAADIGAVQQEIKRLLPGATVTTPQDLASQITGSLASASSLANNLGRWLAIAVLVAAFGLASLLTVSAVARRVREFGTLKALGWQSRRVIGQVLGESMVMGMAGAAAGVLLGLGGAALLSRLAPALTATVPATTGSATPGGARSFGPGGGFPGGGFPAGGSPGASAGFRGGFFSGAGTAHSSVVHLTAQVSMSAVLLAVLLALAGGLLAGTFGGWRAARLRPAAALTRVG